jgi:hypothetical protein
MNPQILYTLVQQDHAERRRRQASERARRPESMSDELLVTTAARRPRPVTRLLRRLPSLAPWSRGARSAGSRAA